jgi:DNA-binding NarL/FixJ family response regulator
VAAINVLLVDREAIMREGLREALESEPDIIVLAEAPDAGAALIRVGETKPDVIVVGLTDPNCADVVHTIRSSFRSCRIVVLSSQTEPAHLLQALKAGVHGILLRRVSGRTLVAAVRAVHAGGTFISGEASTALLRSYVMQASGMEIAGPLGRLSRRERQVLDMVVTGQNSSQIAQQLAISPKSVDTYRGRMMHKIGVNNLPSLLRFAAEHGLMQERVS